MITVLVALGVIGLGGIVLLTRAGSEERAEYVDALVAVGESHGVAEANGECFAAATVDAIGIDALQDVASTDEIRADPGRTLRSWGISLDERQAEEFYDEVNECIDTRQVYLDRA